MNNLVIQPTTFGELTTYAELIAKSSFCPTAMKGKAGDVLIAIQMGGEVGLSPVQSLQNIAVINGKPSIYGDAAMALVQAHPACEDVVEDFDKDTMTATCTVTRKGQKPHTSTFSQKDAEKAGLWGKSGPWKQYTKRMLQMRARGFALRDKFPDALKGLITQEEAHDYPTVTFTEKPALTEPQPIDLPIDEPPPEDNDPIPEAEIIGPDAHAHELVKKTFRKYKMSAKFVKDQLVSIGLNKVEDIPLKDAVPITNQIVKNWEKKKK
jgi:hypothetical protein